mmetsp:Transcript_32649/g.45566  ORF Transcript_32649/g.45566 Transcript_32649/m.45566 type:complete len:417 (+) Transcript_32649:29-1279(+)
MGTTVNDKTAAQYATVGLLGLILAWLWCPYEEIMPLNAWGYGRVAVLMIVSVGWLVVVVGLDAPSSDARQRSQQRLQQAVAQPGAQAAGVTTDWYNKMSANLSAFHTHTTVACGLVVVALVYVCFPQAAVTVASDKMATGWEYLLANYSEKDLFIYGISICFLGSFWTMSIVFAALDFLHGPTLAPFKIQESKQITPMHWVKCLPLVLVNHVVLFATMFLVWEVYSRTAIEPFSKELPKFGTVLVQFLCYIPVADAFFYFPHKLLHANSWLFAHVHSWHHSQSAPFAMSAIYAHPFEFLIGNIPVVAMGPLLVGSHMTTMWLWACASVIDTCLSHCGWQLPGLPGNQSHDYHHSTFVAADGPQNLGTFGCLDHLFGTDRGYLRSWQASLSVGYSTPDYPVDKILAQSAPNKSEEKC